MTTVRGLPRPILVAICWVALALPFLLVVFPPITDLPQQTAQIRLFLETLADPAASEYKIQWFTPYSLSYLLLGVSWAVFGPEDAGRFAMLGVGLIWVLSIHLVSIRRGRSESAAILGTVFFFSHILYWGFFSFAIGWPVFLLWFCVTTRGSASEFTAEEAVELMAVALLLYMCHLLWLIAGLCWLGLESLALRRDLKLCFKRMACLLPIVVAAIVWYRIISSSNVAAPTIWGTTPLSRISLTWLQEAALGGVYGPVENAIYCVCIGWIALSVFQNWRVLRWEIDWPLLLVSAMFLSFALFLPDQCMRTMRFSTRWSPVAAIALLVALPRPVINPVLKQIAALVVVFAFCVATAAIWVGFERKELSGLERSLNSLPEQPNVLGLSYIQTSAFVKVAPFVQVFAYSQVLKGGKVNFSFAEFPQSLVVFKSTSNPPWTGNLEWCPQWVREPDLKYFDFVLVNGTEDMHKVIQSSPALKPITWESRWRLYEVVGRKKESAE